MADKTYTQEEYDALLGQVADLKTQVAKKAEESELDSKVAAATAEIEAKVSDLQTQLDASVLEAEAAKTARDDLVAFLEGELQRADEAAALETRKESRIAQVKEVASFPDEYLETNADRFAAMSDEMFAASLEDWKTIAPKKATEPAKKEQVPSVTAMTAARTTTDSGNVMREVMDFRFNGVDVRTV